MVNRPPTILAIDPGFASLGYSVIDVDGDVRELGVLRTKPSPKRRRVRSVDDSERRLKELFSALDQILQSHDPALVCLEAFSAPRHASVAAKLALVYGMLLTMAHHRQIPIRSVTPQEVKRDVCGSRNASKDALAAALIRQYGSCARAWDRGRERTGGFPDGCLVHGWDALGVAHACHGDELVQTLRRQSR